MWIIPDFWLLTDTNNTFNTLITWILTVSTIPIPHNSHVILFRSFLYQRWSVEVSEVLVLFRTGLFSPLKLWTPSWNLSVHLRAEFHTEGGFETSRLEPLTLFFLLVLIVAQSRPGQESSVVCKGGRWSSTLITWPAIASSAARWASEAKTD